MRKCKLKKGDMVVVVAGKDRGKKGKILQVMPGAGRVLVEHVNLIKKHLRPNPSKNIAGGISERESPIHVSNVMIVDPESGRGSRIGLRRAADGRVERIARKSGSVIG